MSAIKTGVRAAVLAGVIAAATAPSAFAWTRVGDMYVTDAGMSVYGYSTDVQVYFTTASVNGVTRNANYNGHGSFISTSFWNGGQSFSVQTQRNDSNGQGILLSGSTGLGAPTAAPWYAQARTCVDVPWTFDPCSPWTGVVRA